MKTQAKIFGEITRGKTVLAGWKILKTNKVSPIPFQQRAIQCQKQLLSLQQCVLLPAICITVLWNVSEIFHNNELLKRYHLDCEGKAVTVKLVGDALIKQAMQYHQRAKVYATFYYLATGKMQLCSLEDLKISPSSLNWVIYQTVKVVWWLFIWVPLYIHQLKIQRHRVQQSNRSNKSMLRLNAD